MKYFLIISFTALFLWGCGSSIETVNLSAKERLEYAKKLFNDEDYLEAVNELQAIILQYPGNEIIDDAQYLLGMTRYKRGEYILAAYEFSKLVKNMPASEFVPDAQYMLAESYFQLSPNFTLDQKYTKKAIDEFQAFLDFFPTHTKVPEAEQKLKILNDKLAHKTYNDAVIYEKMDYHTAALMYYDDVLEIYHDTKYAPMAMYNKIQILLDRNRITEADEEISKFIARYPDNSNVDELKKIKSSLENKLSASKE